MLKKITIIIFTGFLLLNLYGCWFLIGGAAGGAGTSVWLSGKLTQQVNASYEASINSVKSGLRSLKLEVTKETKEETVDQIMSKYTDGRTIWVDVHKITANSSKIEVRVGAMGSDKAAATEIMNRIKSYL